MMVKLVLVFLFLLNDYPQFLCLLCTFTIIFYIYFGSKLFEGKHFCFILYILDFILFKLFL